MASANNTMAAYKEWVLSQDLADVNVQDNGESGVLLKAEGIDGWVNFYDMEGQIVVELRLEKKSDGSSLYFLHFELEDMDRARQLYLEMASTLDASLHKEVQHSGASLSSAWKSTDGQRGAFADVCARKCLSTWLRKVERTFAWVALTNSTS